MGLLRKPKLLAVVAVVLALAFLGYRNFFAKPQPVIYQTQVVERGDVVSSISVSGQVASANFIKITTLSSGVVSKVFVEDGTEVWSGQTIAEISLDQDGRQKSAKAYSTYLSAKNSYSAAQAKVNSLQSILFKANQKFIDGAVARDLETDNPIYIEENADWLQAEADYKNQQLAIAAAQALLSSAWLDYSQFSPSVVAPQGGKIANISIVEGMGIGGDWAQQVATISTGGTPVVSFNLAEVDVAKVKVGQKATVILDGVPDKIFTGKLRSINKIGVISGGVTNYPILVKFDAAADEVLPNMAATADILLESVSDVLFVPSSAVQTQNGQRFVRVTKGGRIKEVVVETGLSSDTQTEIKSGLSEGDEVVTGTISQGNGTQGSNNTSPFNTFGNRGFGGAGFNAGGGRTGR